METYFAAAKLGAILVPLNFRAKTEELQYMISNATTTVVLTGPRYWELLTGTPAETTECREPGQP